GVEDQRAFPRAVLELVEQPGLSDACVADDRHGASCAADRSREGLFERRELRLPSHEARQAARSAALEPALEGADTEELVEPDRFGRTLHSRCPERLEVEEPRREGIGPLADDDAAGIGEALHALREPDRMADGHDVGVSVGMLRAPDDDLAGVEADPDREAGSLLETQPLGVSPDVVLHAERRVEAAPGVVL